MAESRENPAAQFARRRARNLAFFQRFYPSIYNHFHNLLLTRAEVVIIPEDNDVDLSVEGQSLYEGKALAQGKREVDAFRSSYAPATRLKSLTPPWRDAYNHPRFAQEALNELLHRSPLDREQFQGYLVGTFYPFVVFLGCGLGYQIEALVKQCDVENAIVFEPDCEVFAASLFTVDWESICMSFRKQKGRSIAFFLGVDSHREALWRALARELHKRCPLYPAMTLYFVHRGDPGMQATARRVQEELPVFLSSWGHYDDEVRRLNNAIHGFNLGVKAIPAKGSVVSDIPVFIVGSGPSLDLRLEDIRASRAGAIVISAGTGLGVLLENGIIPDCHVELDPDYIVYQNLKSLSAKQLKQVSLIGAPEICPLIWDLFSDSRVFFRIENPISSVFGTPAETIHGGTPTCTNAALAICLGLGLNNVFLFGTDYGFFAHERHHSAHSIYGKKQRGELEKFLRSLEKKQFSANKTFTIEAVDGRPVNTTATYFGAKRRIEELIRGYSLNDIASFRVYNCSDGARIDGAQWLPQADFAQYVAEKHPLGDPSITMAKLFSTDARRVAATEIDLKLEQIHQQLVRRSSALRAICSDSRLRGKKDITRLVNLLGQVNEATVAPGTTSAHAEAMATHLIRGTLRHFLNAGLCHTMALEKEQDAKTFLEDWNASLVAFLSALPRHFQRTTHKIYDLTTDPLVTQSINDLEDA